MIRHDVTMVGPVVTVFLVLMLTFFASSALAVSSPVAEGSETEGSEIVDRSAVTSTTAGPETFVYQPRGRRDPFAPLVKREDPVPVIQATRRPEALRGPLERYELRQLRLIAVMVVKGDPRAMVAAPDGKSYTVKIDDYIGIDGGRVKDIQTRVMGVDENGLRVEKNPDRIVIEDVGIDSLTGKKLKEERYIVL